MSRFSICAVMFLLLVGLACGDPISLAGTWSGSNARYSGVVLTLNEVGDSVTGSIQVTPTGGSPFTTTVGGERTPDSVYVRGDPLPPSVGPFAFGTVFSGALTFTGQLAGCLSAREQPCSDIALRR